MFFEKHDDIMVLSLRGNTIFLFFEDTYEDYLYLINKKHYHLFKGSLYGNQK